MKRITVPDGVKALKVEGQNNYDESANTDHFVPVTYFVCKCTGGQEDCHCAEHL
ncbi:MAG: hypothetical protein ACLRH0_06090 [Blautia wexlerae]